MRGDFGRFIICQILKGLELVLILLQMAYAAGDAQPTPVHVRLFLDQCAHSISASDALLSTKFVIFISIEILSLNMSYPGYRVPSSQYGPLESILKNEFN